jgi:hypothetical protein
MENKTTAVVSKPECEKWFKPQWGRCRKCTRIVSPKHSNCPQCGSCDIKTVQEIIDEDMARTQAMREEELI